MNPPGGARLDRRGGIWETAAMRGYHDIGGQTDHEAWGPIDRTEHATPDWALLSEALRRLVDDRYCLHEQRRRIEGLGADVYATLTYYELRLTAMAEALTEKGVVDRAELDARMAALRDRGRDGNGA